MHKKKLSVRDVYIIKKKEKYLKQNVIDHIEKCQQIFPMHQTDIYYIKRYLHAATPRLSDRPSEKGNARYWFK